MAEDNPMEETPKKEPTMADHLLALSGFLREQKEEEAKRLLMKVEGLVTAKEESGRSTVHFAAVGGCLGILKFSLIDHEDMVNATDDMGWTPLMIASSAGKVEIVKYLLTRPDIEVNHKNKNGQISLHYAASKNHREIARLLLENGADVNASDRLGETALHRAACQGHDQMVYMLLMQPKIHVDARNREGNTPLFLACEEDREDSAIALAMKGALIDMKNKDERSPLDVVKTSSLRTKLKNASEKANAMEISA